MLDTAVWRRFQTIVEMPAPGSEEIRRLIDQFPKVADDSGITDAQWKTILNAMDGMSYQDMQDRLDNLYDRIDDLEEAISGVTRKMNGACGEKFNAETLCKILIRYDKMFEQMSDAEKKQFFQSFVKSIEIDPNPVSKKRVLKHIEFRFPVSYDAEEGQILLRTENDVETVVCLNSINTRTKS